MLHDPHFHDCPHVIAGKPCGGKASISGRDTQGRSVYKCTRCGQTTSEAELRALVDATAASRGRLTVSTAGAFNIFGVAAILALSFAEPAASGPFEDGVAAYKKQQYVTAMNLWRPLAEAGNPEAQANIGVLFRDAQGVPSGRTVDAYMWFSLAAAGGNKKAASERDILARTMTAEQVAEGKRRVSEWKPRR